MISTSLETWDSVEVDGVETVFYCGLPLGDKNKKVLYLPLEETYDNMGHKMIGAFEWALANKEFDYIARVNSSCYVNKRSLIEYVQTLPDDNVFAGVRVVGDTPENDWCWGGSQFLFSKDVVEKIVANKEKWDHSKMEDIAVSHLVNKLVIKHTNGKSCTIDKVGDGWRCLCYGSESFEFKELKEMIRAKEHHFIRVKQDGNRWMDEIIMKELFKVLG